MSTSVDSGEEVVSTSMDEADDDFTDVETDPSSVYLSGTDIRQSEVVNRAVRAANAARLERIRTRVREIRKVATEKKVKSKPKKTKPKKVKTKPYPTRVNNKGRQDFRRGLRMTNSIRGPYKTIRVTKTTKKYRGMTTIETHTTVTQQTNTTSAHMRLAGSGIWS